MNRQLGFSTFNTNLLTIPQAVLHIILLLAITWFSEKVNDRAFVALIAPFYALPLIAIIRWWPGAGKNIWATYILNTLYVGQPYIHAICVSWVSRNSNHVRTDQYHRQCTICLFNWVPLSPPTFTERMICLYTNVVICNCFYNFDFNPCFALSQGLLCLAKQEKK